MILHVLHHQILSLWRDITIQNRDELIEQLNHWMAEMGRVKSLLQEGNVDMIEQYFAVAKEVRDALPTLREHYLYHMIYMLIFLTILV